MSDATVFFDALLRYEIRLWNVLDAALVRAHGVSLGRLQALRVVRGHGGRARVQDVSDELLITVGAASKLVDRLERDGTARRVPNPDDRRSSLIALTAAGEQLLDAASATFEAVLADCLPPALVGTQDLVSLTATLRKLDSHLGSLSSVEVGL